MTQTSASFWSSYNSIRGVMPGLQSLFPQFRYIRAESDDQIREARCFLRMHFGNPPRTPSLHHALSESDQILLLAYNNSAELSEQIGCIRYKYIGHCSPQNEAVHQIDCFCIHPDWRKKGVGTYLLMALHNETISAGKVHAVFLKEGAPLFHKNLKPLYSSLFAYRRLSQTSPPSLHPNVHSISSATARIYIDQYRQLYPDTFIVLNAQSSHNQIWKLYKNNYDWILALFQDSYQVHPETRTQILWCTGFIESPSMRRNNTMPNARPNAIRAILDTLPECWGWVWGDITWFGTKDGWTIDGVFHWYTYQWNPMFGPKDCYCITV